MRTVDAVKVLAEWDRRGRTVFTLADLRKLFPHQAEKTLSESLRRLVRQGLLERVATGVYANPLSSRSRVDMLERVARALRPGRHSYVSLESALSEWGVISQVPLDYLTVMTTGRKGVFRTSYGAIEFTHTRRSPADIARSTVSRDRPLRLATAPAAWRDLKRVGRNLYLVDPEDMQEYLDADEAVAVKEGKPFRDLAAVVFERNPALVPLAPVVEKELLQRELLHALDRGGWLDGLTFTGGAALRFCYGAPRLSGNLVFSGGPAFTAGRMGSLAASLKRELSGLAPGIEVEGPEKTASREDPPGRTGVSTWRIGFVMAPPGPGLPAQVVNLDIEASQSCTAAVEAVRATYDAGPDSDLLMSVRSREEILAGKLVAFAASVVRTRPRHRDIWDINWLTGGSKELRGDLLRARMRDHRADRSWLAAAAASAGGIVGSPEFSARMRRLLPPDLAERTLDNPKYMTFLASETARIIEMADACLDEEDRKESGRGWTPPPAQARSRLPLDTGLSRP